MKKSAFLSALILLFVSFFAEISAKATETNPFFQDDIPFVQFSITGLNLPNVEDAKGEFVVRVTVPKDHHAYLDKGDKGAFIALNFDFTEVESAGYKIQPLSKPKGIQDKEFEANVLRGKGEFKFSVHRIKGLELIIPPIKVKSQICNDITKICYLPRVDEIPFIVRNIAEQTSSLRFVKPVSPLPSPTPVQNLPVTAVEEGFTGKVTTLYNKYSQNILMSFFIILFSGLLAAGTPCVYPMIPITSAIIMERGGSSRQMGLYHSLMYFFGIIWAYILLGYIAGMTGGAFNAVMQSYFINLFFALLFGFLGLAMLGFFDFTIGESFTSRISAAIGQKGGLPSTFLMGITAGLIISPCVGPLVFALLIQVADKISELSSAKSAISGTISFADKSIIAAKGGLMMGGFGIGIGVPFLIVGLLSNRLPRAGKWMEYVRYGLGMVILYIAWTYYIKGVKTAQINDQAAYTIFAGIVTIFLSIYLGLFRTEKNKLKKGLALFLLLPAFYFMYSGLSQAGIIITGKKASYKVSVETIYNKDGFKIERHKNLEWYRDFDEAKKVALKVNKPIFIDFFAYWCANCLEFEKLSVKNEKLNRSLGKAVLLKIYDTDPIFKTFRDNPIHRELKRGLPYFAILKPNGEFFWKGTQYNAVETMRAMIQAASS